MNEELYNLIPEGVSGLWRVHKDPTHVFLIKNMPPDFCWMSTTAWEQGTHNQLLEESYGDVLCAGLGLGLDPWILKDKENVTSIDVIESEPDVINLVASHIAHPKISVIEDRVLHHLETTNKLYDYVWFDIFPHDPCYFPEETQILLTAANLKLKPNGKVLFWKVHRPIQL